MGFTLLMLLIAGVCLAGVYALLRDQMTSI